MNKFILIAALSTVAAVSAFPTVTFAAANPVPCETMLNDVKAAIKDAKLSDADKAKVMDLQGKGLERCKADDDAGADGFFAAALTIMGK
jgi:2-methylisocitrate lyase-like PEP mutase family enzyme